MVNECHSIKSLIDNWEVLIHTMHIYASRHLNPKDYYRISWNTWDQKFGLVHAQVRVRVGEVNRISKLRTDWYV